MHAPWRCRRYVRHLVLASELTPSHRAPRPLLVFAGCTRRILWSLTSRTPLRASSLARSLVPTLTGSLTNPYALYRVHWYLTIHESLRPLSLSYAIGASVWGELRCMRRRLLPSRESNSLALRVLRAGKPSGAFAHTLPSCHVHGYLYVVCTSPAPPYEPPLRYCAGHATSSTLVNHGNAQPTT